MHRQWHGATGKCQRNITILYNIIPFTMYYVIIIWSRCLQTWPPGGLGFRVQGARGRSGREVFVATGGSTDRSAMDPVCAGCRRSQIYRYCIVCLQKLQHHIKTLQCNKKCYTHLGIVIDHSTIVPCQCLCRNRWLLSLWPLMNGTIRWAEVAGSTPYGPLSQIYSNAMGGSMAPFPYLDKLNQIITYIVLQ